MPNHIHGIVKTRATARAAPTGLGMIIGSFKSTISKQINRINNNTFKWQKSFHDHIIRIEELLNNICTYIINNPSVWNND